MPAFPLPMILDAVCDKKTAYSNLTYETSDKVPFNNLAGVLTEGLYIFLYEQTLLSHILSFHSCISDNGLFWHEASLHIRLSDMFCFLYIFCWNKRIPIQNLYFLVIIIIHGKVSFWVVYAKKTVTFSHIIQQPFFVVFITENGCF